MRSRAGGLAVVLLLLGSSCRGARDPESLTVFAAASLTDAFTRIAADFEGEHPTVQVRLSFGPSDGLATQIQEGAPAEVFASASPTWMDAVAEDPGISDRAVFARNLLIVITPADDPATIGSVEDLAKPGVKLVLAAAGVPAGSYARDMLTNAGVAHEALANVVSNEDDVKGVVQKVSLGEADAGIVYRTDVTADLEGAVRTVTVPDPINVVATYPIGVVAGTGSKLAGRFVAYVVGPGQPVLEAAGFLPP